MVKSKRCGELSAENAEKGAHFMIKFFDQRL